jgi:hypothetical protein
MPDSDRLRLRPCVCVPNVLYVCMLVIKRVPLSISMASSLSPVPVLSLPHLGGSVCDQYHISAPTTLIQERRLRCCGVRRYFFPRQREQRTGRRRTDDDDDAL